MYLMKSWWGGVTKEAMLGLLLPNSDFLDPFNRDFLDPDFRPVKMARTSFLPPKSCF